MLRFLVESGALVTARCLYGDKRVAEYLFRQDYDPGFVSRHSHQLASLMQSLSDD